MTLWLIRETNLARLYSKVPTNKTARLVEESDMLHQDEPKTLHGKIVARNMELWRLHPECKLYVGNNCPVTDIISGQRCTVMVARGPLMIVRYPKAEKLRFLFDAYGT